ncbi:hypothetical protein CUR00_19560 [Acinetobacter baumannii]|uniref:hypothetical protein n=1 Tax=Acinetobacter baumannii TaxID=470 RepID=UPI0018A29CE3|nr:hypothetical protein [Acinetobacter baumannii]MBF7709466.1 hypothetical protein [Acinetobacter baumannii]
MKFINNADAETITTGQDLDYDIYKDIYVWGWNGESYNNSARGHHDGTYTINRDESTEWTIKEDETENE